MSAPSVPPAPAHAPHRYAARIAESPVTAQHIHPFVEGCTCGAGIIGCCPCAVGAVAQPTITHHAAGHPRRFGPPPPPPSAASYALPSALGALSAAGLAFGVRAYRLNRQAQARVHESLQGIRAQRLDVETLRKAHAATAPSRSSCCASKASASPDAFASLSPHSERLRRLDERLSQSARERSFEAWVPGALQAIASAGGLASMLPHSLIGAWHPLLMTVTGVSWALFGAAYACVAITQTTQAIRELRALRRLPVEPRHEDRKSLLPMRARGISVASRTAVARALESAAWLAFSGGTLAMAVPQSSALGLLVATSVGPWLGAGVLASGLGATLLSALLRRPTHTLTLPALRELPMDPSGIALAQLSERCLKKQQRALAHYVDQARAQHGTRAAWLRTRMLWQATTLPSCGPKAYGAVADRAVMAARDEPLGEQALARAVVGVLSAERDLLSGWLAHEPAPPAEPQAVQDGDATAAFQHDLLAAAWQLCATERRRTVLMERRRDVLRELIGEWERLMRRLPSEPADLSDAERQAARAEAKRRAQDVRLATLLAMGMLGEALAPLAAGEHPQVATLPHLSSLPHLHLEPLPQRWPQVAQALRPTLEHTFVRVFCNPHRLHEATRAAEQELASLARHRQSPAAAAPLRAPACRSC